MQGGPPTQIDAGAAGADSTRPSVASEQSGATRRVGPLDLLQLVVLLVPIVVLVLGAWHRRAMSDDAFINLRIVREIYAGHGPVFNPGERVEAATSPLWLAMLTVVGVPFRRHLEWMTLWLNLACTVSGLALLTAGARRLHAGRDAVGATTTRGGDAALGVAGAAHAAPTGAQPTSRDRVWLLPLGVLVLACLTPMWTFAMAGLENGLTTAWLGACLLVLARWATGQARLTWWGAVVLGLGPLVRPEFALYSACFLAAPVLFDGSVARRTRFARLVAALAAPVAFQIFRMGYYGVLLPTSAIAKSPTGSRWGLGWRYVHNTLAPYRLGWALFVCVATGVVPLVVHRVRVGGWRDRRALVVVAFVCAAMVNAVLVVRVGGDYMHARLLLPAVTALVAPAAVVPVRRHAAASVVSLAVVPWAVLSVAVWRSPADKVGYFVTTRTNPVTLADFNVRVDPNSGEPRPYGRPGIYLEQGYVAAPSAAGPQRVVGLYGIGLLSFAVSPDVRVIDLLGLANPVDAHVKLEHRGLNSHERPLPMPWFVALTVPDGAPYRTVPLYSGAEQREHLVFAPQIGRPDTPFADRVAAARRALQCGDLAGLRQSYTAPMTPGRFVSNVLRAPSRTFFVFPAEPSDAVRALCR